MAESEDKNADAPPPRDIAETGEPVAADNSQSAAGAAADTQTGQPNDAHQDDSARNQYGQYEEDWQEAEGQSQDSDEYWADAEQEEHENGYDYDRLGESRDDEYEEEYQDEDGEEEDDEEDEDEDDDEEDEEDEVGQKKMTLVEHLDELRTRIIRALLGLAVGMVIALILSQPAIDIINGPYERATGLKLKATDMMSPFMVYMQISLYMGLLIASPWIFYQIWMFIAAGLYKHERKYVVYAVPFSATLFIVGALFFLLYISPMLLAAFNAFNTWLNVEMIVTLDNNVDFMTNMMVVFGFCFQMPIAVLLLGKMGLVTVKTLSRARRYVIVAILILAALVTSPSPLDQIALAIPMWLLYELGVLLVYLLVEKKRRAEDAAMGYEPIED
jgi:sec-independent protein translocase protein TatC